MEDPFNIDCTGNVCVGDTIKFTENVFGGSYSKPKFLGERTIIAMVVNDSYGTQKQQHTFSLIIIQSTGYDPLKPSVKTTRKGRNIYRNGTKRAKWSNETDRKTAIDEKHQRGNLARKAREIRREQTPTY